MSSSCPSVGGLIFLWFPELFTEEELGFENYSPPYLAPNTIGDVILKSVNYASSEAGILTITGSIFGRFLLLFNFSARHHLKTWRNSGSNTARRGTLPSRNWYQRYLIPAGFESVDSACCRVIGRRGGLVLCGSLSRLCPDRTKFVSWDPFHPTESANLIGAKHAFDGGLQYVSPMNIRQLANA
ncbi:hypothetical protein QUC31_012578 [Theobroma cacao]